MIILGVLAVAVGPAMALLPSRKDRRLAALRAEARRLGLRVELMPVRWLDAPVDARVTAGGRMRTPMHASVCYALPVAERLEGMGPWRLLRGAEGWVPDEEVGGSAGKRREDPAMPVRLIPRLAPLCARLPEDAVAVDFSGHSLGCCWLESFPAQAEAVTGIKAALAALLDELAAFAGIQAAGGLEGRVAALREECLAGLSGKES